MIRQDLRRFALPLSVSAAILLGAAFSRPAIIDALTRTPVNDARLELPFSYRVLAPASNVFDTLTLLSVPQIIAAFLFVLILAALIRIFSTRASSKAGTSRNTLTHLRYFANVIGAFVAIAGLALLSIRPMAALRVGDPDLLAVDFHSHTSASHDGRPTFTPEQNREWHRRAGFDVAYVTDHHTFSGANAAMSSNPAVSGSGVVLLPGLEYRDEDEHVIAIGLDPRRTDPERREWHPLAESQRGAGPDFDVPALLILSLPGDVDKIPADEEIGIARLSGIELSDGSPKGMQQEAADYPSITALARRLNLALVSGSDNHGWGNAAPAWTILRIPNWRTLRPDQLDAAIRRTLLARGNVAARVLRRRVPVAGSKLSLAMTAPEVALEITRDIDWGERLSWLVWTWAIALVPVLVRRRGSVHMPDAAWLMPERTPTES